MPQRMYLSVQEENQGKQTSSFLKSLLSGLSKFVIGLDLFKSVWKSSPEAAQAVAAGTGQNVEQVRAQLRAQGIDPDAYFDALNANLPDNIDGLDATEVNDELQKAQAQAKDSTSIIWLIAAGVLLISLFMGRRHIGRAFRGARGRYRTWRSRPRRSRRGRRR